MSSSARQIVLYDEDCAFCRWSLDKILGWDRRGLLRSVAIQSEEGEELLAGVPRARRLDSFHTVSAAGEVRSAGAGAAPVVELLPGGRPLAALFRAFPGPTDRTYRFVAANRDRFARVLGLDPSCQLRR